MRLDEIIDDDDMQRRNARLSQFVNNITKQSASADAWARRSQEDLPAREQRQAQLKAQQDLRDKLYPFASKYTQDQFEQFLQEIGNHFEPQALHVLDLPEYFKTHNKDAMKGTVDFWKSFGSSPDRGSLD